MKIKHFLLFLLTVLLCVPSLAILPVSAEGEWDEKPVIIIDPGHGGVDGGTPAGIRTEKVYNLIMAQYLREELNAHGGFEVILTREDNDSYSKFLPRAINIIKYDGDLILSLHCNSSEYSYVNGVEAITSLIEQYSAYNLGNSILQKISASTGMANRGVFTRTDTGDSLGVYYWDYNRNWDMPGASYLGKVSDYFSINTWASKFGVPSLIVEHGYLSNSGDRELMDKDETLRAIAKAEAEALIEYYYGHTHSYTAEKVVDFPSNCVITGTKSYHCTVCGIKKDTEPLPASPDAHFYRQSGSMSATCSEDGFIEYTCQISYNLMKSLYGNEVHTATEILPKTEHAYRVTEEIPGGHGTDGTRTEVCDNCGDTVTTAIPGEAHTYEQTGAITPTCTTAGSTTLVCTVCGHSYTEEIPALGHNVDETGICTVCGVNTVAETNPDGTCKHSFTETSRIPATCEEEGKTVSVCNFCGEETTEAVPATGHSYEAGEAGEVCVICGSEKPEERRSLGGIFRSPIFLAVIAIVAVQAAAFGFIALTHKRKTHKTRRTAHNDNKHK